MDSVTLDGASVFQSTHPVRGATWDGWGTLPPSIGFQSTHPVRGATSSNRSYCVQYTISIHAPRAGCDQIWPHRLRGRWISIHAPRAGCDTACQASYSWSDIFQSTHPVRGATVLPEGRKAPEEFQSTHPVRGATLMRRSRLAEEQLFQSTHPVRGATNLIFQRLPAIQLFQSTHPVRGATIDGFGLQRPEQISIHAPRAGCDLHIMASSGAVVSFQSTHPVRGATIDAKSSTKSQRYFNPRTPCGVRLYKSSWSILYW